MNTIASSRTTHGHLFLFLLENGPSHADGFLKLNLELMDKKIVTRFIYLPRGFNNK
jgi:hypothetical protein